MEEITKLLKKYFFIIISILLVIGFVNNKEQLINILTFWTTLLSPFLYGIFIAYILSPLQLKIENKIKIKYRKTISIICTYILFLGCVSLLSYLCVPQLIDSLKELIGQVPTLYNNCLEFLENNDMSFLKNNSTQINELLSNLTTQLSTILPNVLNWLTNIVKTSLDLIIAIIMSVYLLYEKDNIIKNAKRFCMAYFKKSKTNKLINLYHECESILNKFIVGKAIDSFIIGILCSILMMICKLDYVVLISLLVGITNMIPYVGPFIGGIIGFIFLLVSSPKEAIIFGILILILQQFDGYILGPKILGDKVGIKPLWIILSLLIGGAFGGLIGMFLGTPVIAIITHLINKDIENRLKEDEKKEGV